MEMSLERDKEIKQIQKEFSEVYPFLKLEFLNSGDKKTFLSKSIVLNTNTKNKKDATINISGDRTVAELEQDFRVKFNLPIQVFRKAGTTWIETTLTHDWTLEQQNKEGELFSSIVKK